MLRCLIVDDNAPFLEAASALLEREGLAVAGVAQKLWVTEGTVEKHVHSILAKLDLQDSQDEHRRVRAVITFLDAR